MNLLNRLFTISGTLDTHEQGVQHIITYEKWKGETKEQALAKYTKQNKVNEGDEFIYVEIKEKRGLFRLSEAEMEMTPSLVRYAEKTRYITIGVFIGLVLFFILTIASKGALLPLIGFILCLVWVAFWMNILNIGLLVHAWKNGRMGYFLLLILFGALIWNSYVEKVMKPCLAASLTQKN